MKSLAALMFAVIAAGVVAEAAAQTVIDATGLKVNGAAVSPQADSGVGMQPGSVPAQLWIGQANGHLWSCDLGGACTLQADLGKQIHAMTVFNSRLWIGQAEGEVRSCDSSGVCRRHPGQGADILCMQAQGGRLWMGLESGELKSCDSGGNCRDHGDQGEAIAAMAALGGRLWIGQADGQLRTCDVNGACTAAAADGSAILEMATFDGRLWLGRADGALQSCDGAGVCKDVDKRTETVRALAEFDGRLWVGRSDGYLKACDGAGACGDLWDYGGTIEEMAVYNGRVWMAQGAQLRSAFELGTFDSHGEFGAGIAAMAVFAPAGVGRTIHARWNCLGTDQGCVGIGLANPADLLQVHQVDEKSRAYITFSNPATGSGDGNGVSLGLDPSEDFRIHSHEDNNIILSTGDTERLRIDAEGNVGIGTAAPAARLDVNGPIYHRGKQLHADYVFEPAYRIESIEDHAAYMLREKHLQAVPRTRTDENGLQVLEVGAHRRGMLEELEKAHVYIHQLNGQLKAVQARNAALESVVCEIRPEADICRDAPPNQQGVVQATERRMDN